MQTPKTSIDKSTVTVEINNLDILEDDWKNEPKDKAPQVYNGSFGDLPFG